MQLPIWSPETDWSPPKVSELPDWSKAKRIAIDTETRDDHLRELGIGVRRGGHMVGVSFAIEDGPSFYLPIRHSGGGNLDEKQVIPYLKKQTANFKGDYVGANLSYELDYWMEEGIKFHPEAIFRDIQIADPLIYELHKSYSLANIAERYKLPGKDETKLNEAAQAYGVDPKSGLWKLPAKYVGAYAEADVEQPLLILRRQERILGDRNLQKIWELECKVLPVLVNMRRRGIRIDEKKLKDIEFWALSEEVKAVRFVKDKTGIDLGVDNLWKAAAMAPIFDKIGIKLSKTPTGQPEINKEVFDEIDHPVAKALGRARKINKVRTTFAASVRRYLINGRIHCTFNQISAENAAGDVRGVRFGRLSATDPNLQQQPNPEKEPEIAGEWRKIYLPEEGTTWACVDISQQEPRWVTHFAALVNLPKAREMAQAYHDDPNLDNHKFMSELTGLERAFAKILYLGLCYGQGGAKMCRTLKLPTRWALASGGYRSRELSYYETKEDAMEARKELPMGGRIWEAAGEKGQAILDQFDSRAPFIRMLAKEAQNRANRRGYIITGGGRHLHFPQRSDGSFDFTHKALNRLIQGTSADQMKKALVEIDRAGHWVNLQVHDEVDASVENRKEAESIADIMCNTMKAEVPFKVDIELGDSWGTIEKEAA